jgi:hypothetical protein
MVARSLLSPAVPARIRRERRRRLIALVVRLLALWLVVVVLIDVTRHWS